MNHLFFIPRKSLLTIVLFFLYSCIGFSQVAINTDNSAPDASAMLDVKSTDKGMLIPRMTTAQRIVIAGGSPATGLLVYDTTTNSFWYFDGTVWVDLSDTTDVDWLRTNGNTPTAIGQEIYRTGNIGIGAAASNPAFPVDVIGTFGERLRTYSTDDYYAGLIAKNNTREFFIGVQAAFETNDASSGFHIYDNTVGARRFVIDKDGDVGINQSNPNAQLHVNGDVRIVDGTQGAGKILTSDASGFASWQTATDAVDDADNDPTNEIELPAGGTAGQVLTIAGTGGYAWATDVVDDADNDPTNEIELPTGGTAGQLLQTDGAGVVSWVTAATAALISDADSDTQIQVEESTDEDYIRFDVAGTEAIAINNSASVDIHTNAVIGNIGLGNESTDQGTSSAAGLGYTTTPWLYTNVIEAQGERGANSTLITVGADGNYGANDQVHVITDGASRLMVDSNGEVGIGVNNPSAKLDVNGSVNCTGGTCSSDLRWKKDIHPLERALDKVMEMRGVSYAWRTQEFPSKDFNSDRQIGVIAQEVETVYPDLIKTDNEGFKSMDYMSLTAVLLESIKELKQEKDVLAQEMEDLKKNNESLESQMATLLNDVTAIKAMLQASTTETAKTED